MNDERKESFYQFVLLYNPHLTRTDFEVKWMEFNKRPEQPRFNITALQNKRTETKLNAHHSISLVDTLKGNEEWEIHSVQRLSDSAVFQIGDIITDGAGTTNIVMILPTGTLCGDRGSMEIEHAKHALPVYRTTDGVNVYAGDPIWFVFNDQTPVENSGYKSKWTAHSSQAHHGNSGNEYYKVFSTLIAAQQYILCNKPCLSLNEALACASTSSNRGEWIDKLERLVKDKLK